MNRFAAGFPGFTRAAAVALMLGAGAAPALFGAPAAAQGGQFSPVVYVNGKAVTQYEVDQRLRFLTMLRQPGDLQKDALQGVIDDRLRVWAAAQVGLKLTPDDVKKGMEEFASRANLSAENFVKALNQGGVSAETFRDFVTAQITWRELIRAKYAPTVKITDVEVDRALAALDHKPAVRVLLSELVIPVEGDPDDEMAQANQIRAGIHTEAAFAAAAQRYSAAQTAGRGGKLDWMPVANLPPDLQRQVLGLAPGQVTPPIAVPNAVVLLQMRAIADAEGGTSGEQTVDYARVTIADGPDAPAQIARIRAEVDTCNDLYAVMQGVQRETKPLGQVPKDIALELARLDPGESSTALRSGGARVFLMLCARNPVAKDSPSREEVRGQLVGQRLSKLADIYMEQLRSEALIRQP
ncbi:MAG: peptidylprolyl isomerase [Paracoccaceae bacterium]